LRRSGRYTQSLWHSGAGCGRLCERPPGSLPAGSLHSGAGQAADHERAFRNRRRYQGPPATGSRCPDDADGQGSNPPLRLSGSQAAELPHQVPCTGSTARPAGCDCSRSPKYL
ncbi:osm1, partial [Symbiodinium sp. KB8]